MNQKINPPEGGSKNQNKGFTIIEVLVVVAIVGLLASGLSVGLDYVKARSRDARRMADIKSLRSAIEIYQSKQKMYPMPSCPGEIVVESSSDYLNSLLAEEKIINAPIADPINGDLRGQTHKIYYNACGSSGQHTPDPDGLAFNNNESFAVTFVLETGSFEGQGYKQGFNCVGPRLVRGETLSFSGSGSCNVTP